MHLLPTSNITIGNKGDRANHQYDLADFWIDSKAGSIVNMFDFNNGHKRAPSLLLDPSNGTIMSISNGVE